MTFKNCCFITREPELLIQITTGHSGSVKLDTNNIFIMCKRFIYSILFFILLLPNQKSVCQRIDSTPFILNSRLSFYSFEKNGEMLLIVPGSINGSLLSVRLFINDSEVYSGKNLQRKNIIRLPFETNLPPAQYAARAEITVSGGKRYLATTHLTILEYKVNEVKTDRLTGGLIVNRKGWFPFGFYCYSPVDPTLPEEEAVKGFNMMSPYQKILPEKFNERKAYMDRCASLGMKVNYNLLSVSGGGGVGSKIAGMPDEKKKELLISEIKAFMDHPALLAWYISDEPNGFKIPPEELEAAYNTVRETDPWHPASVVFMAPFLSSRKYSNACDIVMADPYPVPDNSVLMIGNITNQLRREYAGKKPVWIVPQAFGGGELWSREPTIQEIRSMTYQSIVNGATGIQYFVRHGLNSFPKSTATWNECGKMAVEIAEMTPWLLSDEETIPVSTGSKNIQVYSAIHSGQLLIIAANKTNLPQRVDIHGSWKEGKTAQVIFENRSIPLSTGVLSDYLSAFGTQAYLIRLKKEEDKVMQYRRNMIKDPGFEDISSPGTPASCYAWNEGDRGATYFLDSKEHYEGNHSLRMTTPSDNMGSRLRFFPIKLTSGKTYAVCIWAKNDNDTIPGTEKSNSTNAASPWFEISLGEFGSAKFYPSNEWHQFVTFVTIPPGNPATLKANVVLRMPGKGTAWFDMLQVFEAVDVVRCINPDLKWKLNY